MFDLPADQHDCDYVTQRNKLIPLAEADASAMFKRETDDWDRAFLGAMTHHAEAARLRGAL